MCKIIHLCVKKKKKKLVLYLSRHKQCSWAVNGTINFPETFLSIILATSRAALKKMKTKLAVMVIINSM